MGSALKYKNIKTSSPGKRTPLTLLIITHNPLNICTCSFTLVNMHWPIIIASLALVVPKVHAVLRFSCSQLVVERLDP